jgi:hypothetical protein
MCVCVADHAPGICGALKGKTVLLVTHQVHLLDVCDKVVVLRDGYIEAQGTLEEIRLAGVDINELVLKNEEVCNLIVLFINRLIFIALYIFFLLCRKRLVKMVIREAPVFQARVGRAATLQRPPLLSCSQEQQSLQR